jgi:hypothetical protein
MIFLKETLSQNFNLSLKYLYAQLEENLNFDEAFFNKIKVVSIKYS